MKETFNAYLDGKITREECLLKMEIHILKMSQSGKTAALAVEMYTIMHVLHFNPTSSEQPQITVDKLKKVI